MENIDLTKTTFSIDTKYQNKLSVKTGEVIGVEVFGRLIDDDGHRYSPALFIPALKKNQQVFMYDQLLVQSALDNWLSHSTLNESLGLSLNIDVASLNEKTFYDFLMIISHRLTSQSHVTLDLDAKDFFSLQASISEKLSELRTAGFHLALELDAYTEQLDSLLEVLPISELKLKYGFTKAISLDAKVESALHLIVSTASKYSLPVTAVGVETESEYDIIKNSGVSFLQGHFFGEEKNQDRALEEALLHLQSGEKLDEQQQTRLICCTDNRSISQLVETLFSSKFSTSFNALAEHGHAPTEIDESALILFDINDTDDITLASNKIRQLGNDIISLVLIPSTIEANVRLELLATGAYDVVEKPISTAELLTKIERMSSFIAHRNEIMEKLRYSESVAFQSMQDASQYGQIVRFMKDVSTCNHQTRLADLFFDYMQAQSLSCSIYFTDDVSEYACMPNGILCPPAELKVFRLLREGKRLHEFGNRLMVNDKNVSFLVKNMPTDENLRGRIRDYVAVIIECLQEKQCALIQTSMIQSAIFELADISQASMDGIRLARDNRKQMIEKVCDDISSSFNLLDLSLEQEDHLTSIIRQALDASEADDVAVHNLVERVESVSTKLELISQLNTQSEEERDGGNNQDDAVELF